jgi:hypothetical protein
VAVLAVSAGSITAVDVLEVTARVVVLVGYAATVEVTSAVA